MMLFWATLIIIVDVRVPSMDILVDGLGGVLVVLACVRLHGAIIGADALRTVLVALAVLSLPVTILDTMAPVSGEVALLALAQLVGTIVLARLLADALARSEPELSRRWHTCFQLLIWLSLVPYVGGVLLGRAAPGTSVESPLVLVLLAVLAIPLVFTLVALWRTAATPAAVTLPEA